jgi:UDP-N-acetylglucosamine--N-acetylmuramyl-(pentapeptide) pyrophosphoryl-undecaprenol N-acetylglucosamine transferase
VSGALRGATSAAFALPRSAALLRRLRPRAVFSVGGYAAGPVALAARALGVPLAVLEPNADIGLANRWVAPLAGRAYTAFPETARFFKSEAVLETGVPLREGFSPKPLGAADGTRRILVLGGSQGARSLNEAVPRALSALDRPVSVVHQAGAQHEGATRELYARLGLAASVRVVPFIDDMFAALTRAELVVGRAGASAVSEICAVGRAF